MALKNSLSNIIKFVNFLLLSSMKHLMSLIFPSFSIRIFWSW